MMEWTENQKEKNMMTSHSENARKVVNTTSALDVQEGGGHYKSLAIQPIEYTVKNKLGFIEGNIVKYVTRHKEKNGAEDLRKIKHYVDLLLELEYNE